MGKLAEIPLIGPGENWDELPDVTAPLIMYVSPTGIIADRRPEISFTVYEEGWLDSVTVGLDHQETPNSNIQIELVSGFSTSIGIMSYKPVSDLNYGDYEVEITAWDTTGNISVPEVG